MFSDIGFIYSNIQIKHREMDLFLLFSNDVFSISTTSDGTDGGEITYQSW